MMMTLFCFILNTLEQKSKVSHSGCNVHVSTSFLCPSYSAYELTASCWKSSRKCELLHFPL